MGGLRLTGPGNPPQLDTQATLGLLGTPGSLSYRIEECEHHFHSCSHVYGKAAGDDFLENSLVPFRVTAGNGGAFGAETLCHAGGVVEGGSATKYMDVGRVVIKAASALAGVEYIIRVHYGTGLFAASTVSSAFSYIVGSSVAGQKSEAEVFPMERIACNNKIWLTCCSDTNGATVDVKFEVHTYPG